MARRCVPLTRSPATGARDERHPHATRDTNDRTTTEPLDLDDLIRLPDHYAPVLSRDGERVAFTTDEPDDLQHRDLSVGSVARSDTESRHWVAGDAHGSGPRVSVADQPGGNVARSPP
jgi:hypothetical protein